MSPPPQTLKHSEGEEQETPPQIRWQLLQLRKESSPRWRLQEREKSRNTELAADNKKKGGGSGRCYICGSEEHLAHRHCGLCKSLEHRTRTCEERGADKGTMLTKLTVPAVPAVRAVAAMVEAALGDI